MSSRCGKIPAPNTMSLNVKCIFNWMPIKFLFVLGEQYECLWNRMALSFVACRYPPRSSEIHFVSGKHKLKLVARSIFAPRTLCCERRATVTAARIRAWYDTSAYCIFPITFPCSSLWLAQFIKTHRLGLHVLRATRVLDEGSVSRELCIILPVHWQQSSIENYYVQLAIGSNTLIKSLKYWIKSTFSKSNDGSGECCWIFL